MKEEPQIFGKTLFVDFLLGMLVVVTALLRVSNAVEKEERRQEKKQESSIETDGLYAIVATWPAEVNDDIDLYVQDPSGNIIFYASATAELMHLEYDDRGDVGDTAMTSSGEVRVDINRERAIIRGGMAGEYAVNVHMFAKRHASPTTVRVALYRLRGDDTEVLAKEVVLKLDGDEVTAFRFTLSAEGEKTGDNSLPVSLTGEAAAAADPQQGGISFPGVAP
ncbi:MAG: hypothetical protein AAB554_02530 [Patescibacteria group bacterium]